MSPFICKFFHVFRNLCFFDLFAQIILIDLSLHLDEVDDACERLFLADRELNRNGICLESVLYHIYNVEEVSAHDIHLVYEDHPRNAVSLCLSPNSFGLEVSHLPLHREQ